jgi:hypothetical protein
LSNFTSTQILAFSTSAGTTCSPVTSPPLFFGSTTSSPTRSPVTSPSSGDRTLTFLTLPSTGHLLVTVQVTVQPSSLTQSEVPVMVG